MAENSIRINKQDQTTVITLKGLLDNELAFNLGNVIEKATPPVILDMKQVPYISVFGSLTILNFYSTHQQKLIIQSANQHVTSMLQLSGTAAYVEFKDSYDSSTPPEQE